jgi:hypothetical protein
LDHYEDAVPIKAPSRPKNVANKEKSENSLIKKIEVNEATPKSMKEWEKLQESEQDLLDSRKVPSYSISYKQCVTTEDIYLQVCNVIILPITNFKISIKF